MSQQKRRWSTHLSDAGRWLHQVGDVDKDKEQVVDRASVPAEGEKESPLWRTFSVVMS